MFTTMSVPDAYALKGQPEVPIKFSPLNSSPFCTVLLPRLLQRIATISGLHPAQLLLACSYTYHTQ